MDGTTRATVEQRMWQLFCALAANPNSGLGQIIEELNNDRDNSARLDQITHFAGTCCMVVSLAGNPH